MSAPAIGEVVTGPTPDGEVVTGEVVAVFHTDGEGMALSKGPCLVVDVAGRERAMRLGDLDNYRETAT